MEATDVTHWPPQLRSHPRDCWPTFVKFLLCLKAGIANILKMHGPLPEICSVCTTKTLMTPLP